jgi:hypothetical protein
VQAGIKSAAKLAKAADKRKAGGSPAQARLSCLFLLRLLERFRKITEAFDVVELPGQLKVDVVHCRSISQSFLLRTHPDRDPDLPVIRQIGRDFQADRQVSLLVHRRHAGLLAAIVDLPLKLRGSADDALEPGHEGDLRTQRIELGRRIFLQEIDGVVRRDLRICMTAQQNNERETTKGLVHDIHTRLSDGEVFQCAIPRLTIHSSRFTVD